VEGDERIWTEVTGGGGLLVPQGGPGGGTEAKRFLSQKVETSLKVMLYNRFMSIRT